MMADIGRKEEKGMTLIVKTVTRLTLGFILIYGVYITLSGHVAPGGGFAGGVIAALSLVHVMLAFGKEVTLKWLHSYSLRATMAIGSLVFMWGVMAGQPKWLFDNGYMLSVCEMAVVGAGMFAIFVALVLLSKTDRDSE